MDKVKNNISALKYYHNKVKYNKKHCETCNKDILNKYYDKHVTLKYHLQRMGELNQS